MRASGSRRRNSTTAWTCRSCRDPAGKHQYSGASCSLCSATVNHHKLHSVRFYVSTVGTQSLSAVFPVVTSLWKEALFQWKCFLSSSPFPFVQDQSKLWKNRACRTERLKQIVTAAVSSEERTTQSSGSNAFPRQCRQML